jgi:hypothetical protein
MNTIISKLFQSSQSINQSITLLVLNDSHGRRRGKRGDSNDNNEKREDER